MIGNSTNSINPINSTDLINPINPIKPMIDQGKGLIGLSRLFSVLFILSLLLFPLAAMSEDNSRLFKSLKQKLIKDGFSAEKINVIFSSPTLVFEEDIASKFFMHREAKLNYKQFTTPESIANAQNYLKAHNAALTKAQKIFGVDKTVITAIILVETRLGTIIGNSSILNTLSTLASLDNPVGRDFLWQRRLNSYYITREEFNEKAIRRSKWAYNELKAFLAYTAREKMNPAMIAGSYAGALGIAQFMPSNILLLGKDGDGDGIIDLCTHADAIISIANYLKYYGWTPGIGRDKAYKVIYHYNHSSYYVNTVLTISDLLKG